MTLHSSRFGKKRKISDLGYGKCNLFLFFYGDFISVTFLFLLCFSGFVEQPTTTTTTHVYATATTSITTRVQRLTIVKKEEEERKKKKKRSREAEKGEDEQRGAR